VASRIFRSETRIDAPGELIEHLLKEVAQLASTLLWFRTLHQFPLNDELSGERHAAICIA